MILLDLGYCDTLKGNLKIEICRDKLVNETPYKMVISLVNENNLLYKFPEIKFGIYEDAVYFYAMQKIKEEENSYSKKVNRILYKTGQGFDSKLDNYDIYEEGNLNDVTPSFLTALSIAFSYFDTLGLSKFIAVSILPVRWNSKKIAENLKNRDNNEKNMILEKQEFIQRNLTDKFIRTFLRLKYHFNSVKISSFPSELDFNLHLKLEDVLVGNNDFLNEVTSLVYKNNSKKRN